MRFRLRKTKRFGPFYVTVNQAGRLSFGIKLGRFSHNFTRRTTHIDTPGPGSLHFGSRRRRPR